MSHSEVRIGIYETVRIGGLYGEGKGVKPGMTIPAGLNTEAAREPAARYGVRE